MSSFRFDLRDAGRLGRASAGVALVLWAGAVGGCGSDSGVDYSVEANFCQAVAQADCSQPVVQECYGSDAAQLPTDVQTCVTFRSTPEVCNPLNLPYHAAYAQPCVDAHTAAYGTGQLDVAALQTMIQACNQVFNSGGEQGEQCSADTDCDAGSGLSCVIHQGPAGTCETPATVTAGSSCAAPAAECTAGYFCDTSAAGDFCVAQPTQGACTASIGCGTGFQCDATGVCESQLQDGSACTVNGDCIGGVCITTSTGGVCAATYTFAVGSATCADFGPK